MMLDFGGVEKEEERQSISPSEIVYQNYSDCDRFDIDESQLCDFCSHIRPPYLLTRVRLEGDCRISLGTPVELESRQKRCAFCRWCLQVAQADSRLRQYTIDEEKTIRICGYRHELSLRIMCKKTPRSALPFGLVNIISNRSPLFGSHANSGGNSANTDLGTLNHFLAAPLSVDWAVPRQWKTVCEGEHEACRRTGTGWLPRDFRLIDVESKSLVDVQVGLRPQFVALSYVWGVDSSAALTTLTTRANLASLKKAGGLHGLPRTILHAMDACKRLGEQYLWVDRLCIVQDDKEDKYGQIRSLGAIYSCANLVIVAACGDGMDSGLPGVSDEFPREKFQVPTDIFGLKMVNLFHDFDEATLSTWKERGWTYQEAVLARRKLYFTPAEVWFECAEGVQRENVISGAGRRFRWYLETSSSQTDDVFEQYNRHLEEYSGRILTYTSDICHAFHGIASALYPEGEIIYGLPESDFSRALLWCPHGDPGFIDRRCSDKKVILPSWSWASILPRTYFPDENKDFYCPLCEWTVRNEDGSQNSTRRINSTNDDKVWERLDKDWAETLLEWKERGYEINESRDAPGHRLFLALAWLKGCVEAELPTDLRVPKTGLAMSAKILEARWPTVRAFWEEVHRSSPLHTQGLSGSPNLGPGYLLTRTQYSVLCVDDSDPSTTHDPLIRHKGKDSIIGLLVGTAEYRLRGTAAIGVAANVDFIALGVGQIPYGIGSVMNKVARKENDFRRDGLSHLDPPIEDHRYQPGVIIMAVGWDGPIACRIALGWVTLQGWVDSMPTFRTVVLA